MKKLAFRTVMLSVVLAGEAFAESPPAAEPSTPTPAETAPAETAPAEAAPAGSGAPAPAPTVDLTEAAKARGSEGVHWSEVQVRKRVSPDFPREAKGNGDLDVTCRMRIEVNPKGVPTRVTPADCPALFVDSATAALLEWRFYPHLKDGKPVSVMFDLSVIYRLR